MTHHYIARHKGEARAEELVADRIVTWLYSRVREQAPALFRALTSHRASSLLGFFNYDLPLGAQVSGAAGVVRRLGIDLSECVQPASWYVTPRRVFERQIRYGEVRPMDPDPGTVVSPADARLLAGSLREDAHLFIKDKFFAWDAFLGREGWIRHFAKGDFVICRLTPEKYHYNHVPVSGVVADCYEVDGTCHSCNPAAVIAVATPFSQNRRTVTVIDTDVEGGSRCGMVAMVEVVALMIGRIEQAYSETGYAASQAVRPGLFLRKGQPKSLYRPGSSLDVVVFEPGRVRLEPDLLANQGRMDVGSRFSAWLERPWVETDVRVRETIARVVG